jgi:hypothetical protein
MELVRKLFGMYGRGARGSGRPLIWIQIPVRKVCSSPSESQDVRKAARMDKNETKDIDAILARKAERKHRRLNFNLVSRLTRNSINLERIRGWRLPTIFESKE